MLFTKKGQAAFELILLTAVAFFIMSIVFFYFSGFLNDESENKNRIMGQSLGESIVTAANEMYNRDGFARKVIRFSPPSGILGIKVEGNNLLIEMQSSLSSGMDNIIIKNNAPISSQLTAEDIAKGVITVENKLNVIMICGGTSCTCVEDESTNLDFIGDGLDQDCDGIAK